MIHAELDPRKGLLIVAPEGPLTAEDFRGVAAIVHNHHRDIERVAAVTDSDFLRIAPAIARHFLRPEIRVFPSNQEAEALAWLQTDT